MMKLIGELKEKVEAVECDMEKKAIIACAGMLLTDDTLKEVSGGVGSIVGNAAKADCVNPEAPNGDDDGARYRF